MPYKDPQKQKEAQKASYERTKEKRMTKQAKDRHAMRQWMLGLKYNKPCVRCKGIFHPAAMHWHHKSGQERKGATCISQLVHELKKDLVLKEIAKCDLVCANCHAVETWGEDYIETKYAALAQSGRAPLL